MKIAITGASGFIGKHLTRRLMAEGIYLKVLIRDDETLFQKETPSLEIYRGDLLQKETLGHFVKDADIVVHLAGAFPPPFENLVQSNVIATANLLEACSKAGVNKIIFSSSGAVYGNPKRAAKETDELRPGVFYSLTKKFAEDVLKYYDHNFGIKHVILRFSNVYGPENKKGVVYEFWNSIQTQNQITVYGDGSQARNFLFVSDAVESIVKIIKEYPFQISEVFNISNEELITINELIGVMGKILQKKINVIYKPQHADFIQIIWEDIEKAEKELHWRPAVSLEEGIKATIDSLSTL